MKFYPGLVFVVDGIEYSIFRGKNCQDDMKIGFRVLSGGVHIPTITHMLILASFKYQVEENNYGPQNGKVQKGQGGGYLISRIVSACENGWEQADKCTRREREAKKRAKSQPSLF